MMDSATPLSAPRRMTGWGLGLVIVSGLENPPKGSLVLQDSFTDALSTGFV